MSKKLVRLEMPIPCSPDAREPPVPVPEHVQKTCPLCGGDLIIRQGFLWRWVMHYGGNCEFLMELTDYAKSYPARRPE